MQDFDKSLQKKYNEMKESAKELAVMVKAMLDEEGFYLAYPRAAGMLLKYLDNLNKKITSVENEAVNESV